MNRRSHVALSPASNPRALQEKTFILLLVAVTLAFAWILWPYFGAIFWAAILAILFTPLYRWLLTDTRRRPTLAALVTLTVIVLIVILPSIVITAILLEQAVDAYQRVQSGQLDIAHSLQAILAALPTWVTGMLDRFGLTSVADIQDRLSAGLGRSLKFFASQALNFGQNALEFVVAFFIMLYLLFFLLRDGRPLRSRASDAIPLSRELQHELSRRFTTVIRATIKGNIVVAIVQGALGGLAFWFLDIRGSLLWAVLMALLSLLPAVGTALVWLPVAIYLIATGQTWQGAGLIAYGVVVIGLVDNVLRPLLVGKDTKMPDYLVLLSTLGGLAAFGFSGFVIGPIIAAMFIAVWDTVAAERTEIERAHHGSPTVARSERSGSG
jgi:predicted PurR-regulated permease PerM